MSQRFLWVMSLFALLGIGASCQQRTAPVPTLPRGAALSDSSATADDPSEKTFIVKLETTKGDIEIEVHPSWAPLGAKRLRELVDMGFYNDIAFFRVVPGFMVQFGMNGNPELHNKWSENTILDEPVKRSNKPGYVTFAKTGQPDSRSTQLFINYGDNTQSLDPQGFAPIGQVTKGMDIALAINAEYGESPDQGQIRTEGNEYLKRQFPRLDYILKASIIDPSAAPANPSIVPATN